MTKRFLPPDPEVDGYHWVRRFRSGPAIPLYWTASWHRNAGNGWGRNSQPDREHLWEYIGPCPSPDERYSAPLPLQDHRSVV